MMKQIFTLCVKVDRFSKVKRRAIIATLALIANLLTRVVYLITAFPQLKLAMSAYPAEISPITDVSMVPVWGAILLALQPANLIGTSTWPKYGLASRIKVYIVSAS